MPKKFHKEEGKMANQTVRIERLEGFADQAKVDIAVLKNDHQNLKNKVDDPERGLEAAHQRIDCSEKLAVEVSIAVKIGKWILVTFGALIALLIFNILTHAVELKIP
jgi:hypothetical protein